MQAKPAEKKNDNVSIASETRWFFFLEKMAHLLAKVRLFSFPEEDRLFIFSALKVRKFISKKVRAPPTQNQMFAPKRGSE